MAGSDVWGLGAVLYEILTGRPPFVGGSPYEIIGKVMKDQVRPAEELETNAPAELVAIARCALDRNKDRRYENAAEMSGDLTAFMSGARVGVYEYSSWELLKRFAGKKKATFIAASTVFVMILISLVFVSFSYKRESAARKQEHIKGLLANQHPSQAYAMEARRLLASKMPMSAGIFASASLVFNPANPNGEFYDAQYAKKNPEASRIKAETDSQLYRSRFRFVDSLVWTKNLKFTVLSLSVSPGGKYLAVGDYKGSVEVLDAETGEKSMSSLLIPTASGVLPSPRQEKYSLPAAPMRR